MTRIPSRGLKRRERAHDGARSHLSRLELPRLLQQLHMLRAMVAVVVYRLLFEGWPSLNTMLIHQRAPSRSARSAPLSVNKHLLVSVCVSVDGLLYGREPRSQTADLEQPVR